MPNLAPRSPVQMSFGAPDDQIIVRFLGPLKRGWANVYIDARTRLQECHRRPGRLRPN